MASGKSDAATTLIFEDAVCYGTFWIWIILKESVPLTQASCRPNRKWYICWISWGSNCDRCKARTCKLNYREVIGVYIFSRTIHASDANGLSIASSNIIKSMHIKWKRTWHYKSGTRISCWTSRCFDMTSQDWTIWCICICKERSPLTDTLWGGDVIKTDCWVGRGCCDCQWVQAWISCLRKYKCIILYRTSWVKAFVAKWFCISNSNILICK